MIVNCSDPDSHEHNEKDIVLLLMMTMKMLHVLVMSDNDNHVASDEAMSETLILRNGSLLLPIFRIGCRPTVLTYTHVYVAVVLYIHTYLTTGIDNFV